VFLAAVSPGYAYQRIVEQRVIRQSRSPLLTAVDLLCIGALCTAIGLLITLVLAQVAQAVLVPIPEAAKNHAIFAEHPWRALATVLTALILSQLVAFGLATTVKRRTQTNLTRLKAGSVWARTFARFLDAYGGLASSQKPNSPTRGATASLYLVLNLRDGRTLGGQLAVGDLVLQL